MNTITLHNQAVTRGTAKKNLGERIGNYFRENMETVALGAVGLYTLSGKMPDAGTLRALNLL